MGTRLKKKPTAEQTDERDLLRVPQVAKLLSVSRMTVYRLVTTQKLKAVKLGKLIRFRRADVERLIERGCH